MGRPKTITRQGSAIRSKGGESGPYLFHGRRTRLWLLLLLVLAGLFALGALLARYKLQSFRNALVQVAESRTGARLRCDAVLISGLQGFQIEGLHLRHQSRGGPVVEVQAPVAHVDLDLTSLFSGQMVVNRIRLEGAAVSVALPEGAAWFHNDLVDSGSPLATFASLPFRLWGENCTLTLNNMSEEQRLEFSDLSFEVWRLAGSPEIVGKSEGRLSGPPPHPVDKVERSVVFSGRYTAPDDFDLRITASRLDAKDIEPFLPASGHLVGSGVVSPTLRIEGWPESVIEISLDADFRDVTILGQPEFLGAAAGHVDLRASYEESKRMLIISSAQADTEDISGNLRGEIRFGGPLPELDLEFEADKLPAQAYLNYALPGLFSQYGQVDVALDEPYEIVATLTGNTEQPVWAARALASSAHCAFTPTDDRFPSGGLEIGTFHVTWDSSSRFPHGSLNVVDGTIDYPRLGLDAADVSATVTLAQDKVEVSSLNASLGDEALVASLVYHLPEKQAELHASGALSNLEQSSFLRATKDTRLSGSVRFDCSAVVRATQYVIEGEVDATDAQIGHNWWFLKPAGIPARGHVSATLVPDKQLDVVLTQGILADSRFETTSEYAFEQGKWALVSSESSSDRLDVINLGRCLNIPYRLAGGIGREGRHSWRRSSKNGEEWTATMGCRIDELRVEAATTEHPMVFHDLTVSAELIQGLHSKGDVALSAAEAEMPSLGQTWFVPLRTDPQSLERWPPVDRDWTVTLSGDKVSVPPWKGVDFEGVAYNTPSSSGLRSYSAKIDDGLLSGSYDNSKTDNVYTVSAEWKDIPVYYLLRHLHLPEILDGVCTGNVAYSLDRDDPHTRKGEAEFTVRDGQFSADAILSQFEEHLAGDVTALPPSLRFSLVESDVVFERDLVQTPMLHLASEGIDITGAGQFVIDGDMEYQLDVSISPEVAERIPALRDSFLVEGHRLAQQNIEIPFKITGPMINPQGQVTGLPPVSVTIMSGALEMTSEAMRVIRLPGKLLVDLLKIGGGIVGSSR